MTIETLEKLFAEGNPTWAKRLSDLDSFLLEIESKLQENPKDLETRLWWVHGNLLKGGLPLVALSSPLEELFPELKDNIKFTPQGYSLFIRVAYSLQNKGQFKLAIQMYERALSLLETGPADTRDLLSGQKNFLLDSLQETLEQESLAAEKRRENKSYLAAVNKRISEVKALPRTEVALVPDPPVNAQAENQARNKDINAKSILEESLAKNISGTKGSKKSEGLSSSKDKQGSKSSDSAPGTSGLSVLAIFFFAGLALIYGLHQWLNSPEQVEEAVVAVKPVLQPVTSKTSAPSKELSAEAAPEREKGKAPVPLVTPSSPIEVDKDSEKLAQLSRRVNQMNQPSSKEEKKIESSGTDEAALAESAKIISKDSESEQVLDHIPEVDLPKAAALPSNIKTEHLPVDTRANIYRGRDGNTYGPPPGSGIRPISKNQGPVKGYPVRQLERPQPWETITATDVYTAPSLMSRAVVRLQRGTRISVVSRMGNWLELKSLEGKKGYIYAQDAVKR